MLIKSMKESKHLIKQQALNYNYEASDMKDTETRKLHVRKTVNEYQLSTLWNKSF